MSIPPDQRSEHPSTYFMPDRSNEEELNRLQLQDQMATLILGGLLPEQTESDAFSTGAGCCLWDRWLADRDGQNVSNDLSSGRCGYQRAHA